MSCSKPYSAIQQALIDHAQQFLGLTPDYQAMLEPGICFGLAASASVYHAENRFRHFLCALSNIMSRIPSLLARELIERCFFLQSPNIQSKVTRTHQTQQLLIHMPLLASIDIHPTYLELSKKTLISLMSQLEWQHIGSVSILLSLNHHAVALIYHQDQWRLVDSLQQVVTSHASPDWALDNRNIKYEQLLKICLIQKSTNTIDIQALLSIATNNSYFRLTGPWAWLDFGTNYPPRFCPVCKITKSMFFATSKIPGVVGKICRSCFNRYYHENTLRTCSNPACATSTKGDDKKNQPKTGAFHASKMQGVDVLICHNCYCKPRDSKTKLETCSNPDCTKSTKGDDKKNQPIEAIFHTSNMPGVNGVICSSCYMKQYNTPKSGICSNPDCTSSTKDDDNQNQPKKRAFHTSNMPGVNGVICSSCYMKQYKTPKSGTCSNPDCAKSTKGDDKKNQPIEARFHIINMPGVVGEICDDCYKHRKNKIESGTCSNPDCVKSTKGDDKKNIQMEACFQDSNITGVSGKICDDCYKVHKKKTNFGVCSNPACATSNQGDDKKNQPKTGRFHPINMPGVNGEICHTCYCRHHNNTKSWIRSNPACTTSTKGDDKKNQTKKACLTCKTGFNSEGEICQYCCSRYSAAISAWQEKLLNKYPVLSQLAACGWINFLTHNNIATPDAIAFYHALTSNGVMYPTGLMSLLAISLTQQAIVANKPALVMPCLNVEHDDYKNYQANVQYITQCYQQAFNQQCTPTIIFIPILKSGHYTLLVLNTSNQQSYFLDTLPGSESRITSNEIITQAILASFNMPLAPHRINWYQQTDGTSCGILVMAFIQKSLENFSVFDGTSKLTLQRVLKISKLKQQQCRLLELRQWQLDASSINVKPRQGMPASLNSTTLRVYPDNINTGAMGHGRNGLTPMSLGFNQRATSPGGNAQRYSAPTSSHSTRAERSARKEYPERAFTVQPHMPLSPGVSTISTLITPYTQEQFDKLTYPLPLVFPCLTLNVLGHPDDAAIRRALTVLAETKSERVAIFQQQLRIKNIPLFIPILAKAHFTLLIVRIDKGQFWYLDTYGNKSLNEMRDGLPLPRLSQTLQQIITCVLTQGNLYERDKTYEPKSLQPHIVQREDISSGPLIMDYLLSFFFMTIWQPISVTKEQMHRDINSYINVIATVRAKQLPLLQLTETANIRLQDQHYNFPEIVKSSLRSYIEKYEAMPTAATTACRAPSERPPSPTAKGQSGKRSTEGPESTSFRVKQEPIEERYSNQAQLTVYNPLTFYPFPLTTTVRLVSQSTGHSTIKQNIANKLNTWLTLTTVNGKTRCVINDSYAQDIESCLHIQQIQTNDPREGLRGQYGIFASKKIAKYTPVGVYAGKMYLENELPLAEDYSIPNAYLFEMIGSINRKKYEFIIDANECGNWTALVNAYTTYAKGEIESRQNCQFMRVHYKGFPLMLLIAIHNIEIQQELLVDYGESYWLNQADQHQKRLTIGTTDNPIEID